jgi:pantoate--beta-alanine ligase
MSNPLSPPITAPAEMRRWSRERSSRAISIAFVPTMGALHDGHDALVRHAQMSADVVVVSIFVNPLQFDRSDDFDHYPRPIDDDVARCALLGVDAVYAPTAGAMYPAGFQTTVTVGALASTMEGASRPGHFDGVATVVTKLFGAVRPDVAIFGEKDFQQLAIVRRVTSDLDLGIEIVGHPIVREADGLALSSRNTRLSTIQRAAATVVPDALRDAAVAARKPGSAPADIVDAALTRLHSEPLATVDYVALIDAHRLTAIDRFEPSHRRAGSVRIATAVFVGDVRLIDNCDPFA